MTEAANRRRNIAILTEYDGSSYHGWQYQDNAMTVQQALQDTWFKLTGEKISLAGSSRTDTGVSARGHVSNFRTDINIPQERVALAFNSYLPPSISVRAATEVDMSFNARMMPIGKRYCYRYWLSPVRPALQRNLLAHVPGDLDIDKMKSAIPFIVGKHDFTCMMDQGSVIRETVRTIHKLELERQGRLLTMTVEGDGFLYHMIRILAGTLLYIGQGKMTIEDLKEAFAGMDRKKAGKTMPAEGLCLEWVFFNQQIFEEAAFVPTEGGFF